MKTIFISIAGRAQARNILRTDVLETLCEAENVRVVVFVPSNKVNSYRNEFRIDNVIFEGVHFDTQPISKRDAFFYRLSLFYINTPTGRYLRKLWLYHERQAPLRYMASLALLYVCGSLKGPRSLGRFLDFYLVRDERLSKYFDIYKPDCIFAPNIMEPINNSLIRLARRRKISSVGMIHAWDNITLAKYPFRIMPDKLICYNETIARDAVQYLDMSRKNIYISGIPQFDFYVTNQRASRAEFCKRIGIDVRRRIILLTSVGNINNPTEWQTLSLLSRALSDGTLPQDIVIVFRQHPTQKTKIDNINPNEYIVIDDSKTTLRDHDEKEFSEILKADMEHLADSLFHASLVITTTSSTSIDSAAFDTPVINIAFDGWETRPFHQSVRRRFTRHHAHYQPIVKSGGVRIVRSFDELVDAIHHYLENPALDKEGRKRIVREQCDPFDGKAGKRIGEFVLSNLGT